MQNSRCEQNENKHLKNFSKMEKLLNNENTKFNKNVNFKISNN